MADAGAPVPLFRVDEPMAEQAAATPGGRVGVLATVATTLAPTANLVRRKGAARVESVLVAGAFDALQAGRATEHDERVLAALGALLGRVDVVVLAQASLARVAAVLGDAPRVPVLTSPVSGLVRAGQRLAALP